MMKNLRSDQKKLVIFVALVTLALGFNYLSKFPSGNLAQENGYTGACVAKNGEAALATPPKGHDIAIQAKNATCYFKGKQKNIICNQTPANKRQYRKIRGTDCFAHRSIASKFKRGKSPERYGVRVVGSGQQADAIMSGMGTSTHIKGL